MSPYICTLNNSFFCQFTQQFDCSLFTCNVNKLILKDWFRLKDEARMSDRSACPIFCSFIPLFLLRVILAVQTCTLLFSHWYSFSFASTKSFFMVEISKMGLEHLSDVQWWWSIDQLTPQILISYICPLSSTPCASIPIYLLVTMFYLSYYISGKYWQPFFFLETSKLCDEKNCPSSTQHTPNNILPHHTPTTYFHNILPHHTPTTYFHIILPHQQLTK